MVASLAQKWWTFTLRGVSALLFGVLAFVAPGATLTTLVYVFGFYAILNGVLAAYDAEQAAARTGGVLGNRGAEIALAAIQMARLRIEGASREGPRGTA